MPYDDFSELDPDSKQKRSRQPRDPYGQPVQSGRSTPLRLVEFVILMVALLIGANVLFDFLQDLAGAANTEPEGSLVELAVSEPMTFNEFIAAAERAARLEQYDAAVTYYSDALDAAQDSTPRSSLAQIYAERAAIYARTHDAAPHHYSLAISDFIEAGDLYYDADQYADAEAAYTEALSLAARESLSDATDNAYYQRGMTRYFLTNYEAAIADYTRALSFSPDLSAFVYYFRGRAYQQLAQAAQAGRSGPLVNDARDYYDSALESYTESIVLCGQGEDRDLQSDECHLDHLHRAEVYDALGQPDDALADYIRALDIQPDTLTALQGLFVLIDESPDVAVEIAEADLLRYRGNLLRLQAEDIIRIAYDPASRSGDPLIVEESLNDPTQVVHVDFRAQAGQTLDVTVSAVPRLTGARLSDIETGLLLVAPSDEALHYVPSNGKTTTLDRYALPATGSYTLIIAIDNAQTQGPFEARIVVQDAE